MSRICTRVTAALTSLALLVVQTAALAEDAQHAAGAAGQVFGTESLPDPSTLFSAPEGGSVTVFPGGDQAVQVPIEQLFPGANGPAVTDLESLFGHETEAHDAGASRAGELMSEPSAEGEAYRTVLDSREKIGPDLRDDPIFGKTRETFEALKTLGSEFSDCTEASEFVPGTATGHVPDYKRCERLALPAGDACTITHELQVDLTEYSGTLSVKPSVGDGVVYDTPQALDVTLDLANGTASWLGPSITYDRNGNRRVAYDVPLSAAITSMPFDTTCAGREADTTPVTFAISKTSDDPSSPSFVWPGAYGSGTAGYIIAVSSAAVTQQPSCANHLVAKVHVSGGECRQYDTRQGGENSTYQQCSETVDFGLSGQVPKVIADTWAPQSCIDRANGGASGICTQKVTVTTGPASPADCWNVGGRTICPGSELFGQISRPPFDQNETTVSRLSERVEVSGDCKLPEVVCYEDDQGNQVCPSGPAAQEPVTDTCEQYRTNPACSFVSTAVVEDALDNNGNPYVWEDTYDCGYAVSEGTVERKVGLICPSAIPGIGSDFITPPVETNESFAKVAATLEAANMMAMDADCKTDDTTGETHCDLFGGQFLECKKAVGGVVNCCESPTGVSLAQYMQLVFAVRELDGAIGHLDPTSPLRGAWETMTGPIDSAWSELTEPLTSAFNSITGSTTAQAGDAAAQGLMGTVEQAMLHQVAEWSSQIFGAEATNMLFSSTAVDAVTGSYASAVDSSGVMADTLQLGGGEAIIGSVLSWVMAAYTIYSVTMILIQIAWKCKKSEFEVAAKQQLKSCHYNGTYCKSKVLGFCIERRQSYCCFASPLSRILQEQLRPLIGRGWGSAKSPDCGPIDVEDFQKADWSKVDLSEWMSILIATGKMPDAGSITVESLTGSGRALAAGIAPDVREGTPERTQDRLQDLPVDDIMNQAKQELLGATGASTSP